MTAAPAGEATPTAPAKPNDAIQLADEGVVDEVMAALKAGGSDCRPYDEEPGVVICDRDKDATPTVIITYNKPSIFFITHFLRKEGKSCDDTIGKLNELNKRLDSVKLVCDEGRVSFVNSILVPTYGLSPKDVQQHVAVYQDTIRMVLKTGGMLEYLQ